MDLRVIQFLLQRRPGRTLSAAMHQLKVDPRDGQDRRKRRALGRGEANPTASGKLP